MGIDHALHEYLPLYETARATTPGTSTVTTCRARRRGGVEESGDILPALSETDPLKGMAEVVMIRRPRWSTPSPTPPATVSRICLSVQKIFVRVLQ